MLGQNQPTTVENHSAHIKNNKKNVKYSTLLVLKKGADKIFLHKQRYFANFSVPLQKIFSNYKQRKIMRKTITLMALMAITATMLTAQNKFEGIVTYSLESVGEVDVPLQEKSFQINVYQDKAYLGNEQRKTIVNGRKVFSVLDLSQLISGLQANDVWESDYDGNGKVIASHEMTQEELDSITIPDTKGMYIEYVGGETRDIMGYKAQKAKYHVFNEEGVDKGFDVWYTTEIGPEYDFVLCAGLKGFPLEFIQSSGDGKAVQYKVSGFTKGKVKKTDFMLPDGFDILTEEAFSSLMKDIQEAMALMQE